MQKRIYVVLRLLLEVHARVFARISAETDRSVDINIGNWTSGTRTDLGSRKAAVLANIEGG